MSGPQSDWHLPGAVLDAYLAGSASEAAAWSAEEHLAACADCRAALARADASDRVDPGAKGPVAVAEVRWRLLRALPPQPDIRRGSAMRRARVLFASPPAAFWAWLVAVVVVLIWALVLDVARVPLQIGTGAGAREPAAAWLQLLVPLLPIIGVACSFGGAADPAHELLASTPAGGLRLLLYRCCTVLTSCLPLAALFSLLTGGVDGVAWLVPALSLTVLTLALGCVVSLGLGAAIAAALWLAVTGVPLMSGQVPRSVTVGASPLWVAGLLVGVLVVITRADRIRRPTTRSSRAR